MAQGGSFKVGFAANAIGAAAGVAAEIPFGPAGDGVAENVIARTTVAAVAGGTASELSGGKFGNGALTAAMAHTFNAEGAGEGIHTALDVAGLTPFIGNIADVANAFIYTAKGDFGNAAIAMGAAIPGVGQGVTGAKLAGKYSDDVIQVTQV